MDEYINIFEKPFRPKKEMSRVELETELETWRNLWTWHEDVLQYWLTKVRSAIKVKLRNFTHVEGTLGMVHYELKTIDIDTTERIYNYLRGEAVYETKTVTIPVNQLVDIAFIHDKEVISEKPSGEPSETMLDKIESEIS